MVADRGDRHFKTNEKVLNRCYLLSGSVVPLNITDDTQLDRQSEPKALPERKENHRLDREELGQRSERLDGLLRCEIQQHQPIQRDRNRHVDNQIRQRRHSRIRQNRELIVLRIQQQNHARRLHEHKLQTTRPHRVHERGAQPNRRQNLRERPGVPHSRLCLEVVHQRPLAAAKVDEEDEEVVDDEGLVAVPEEVGDEGAVGVAVDE
mmetsp:Transcript_1043/g.2989  ORF Transcript_1043/g.2989 Transcript_1043/m.2989 type:complete len:207 (-) Transcript_1043:242-862(-)